MPESFAETNPRWTPLPVAAGDLVLLHGGVAHMSHQNTSAASRHAYASPRTASSLAVAAAVPHLPFRRAVCVWRRRLDRARSYSIHSVDMACNWSSTNWIQRPGDSPQVS